MHSTKVYGYTYRYETEDQTIFWEQFAGGVINYNYYKGVSSLSSIAIEDVDPREDIILLRIVSPITAVPGAGYTLSAQGALPSASLETSDLADYIYLNSINLDSSVSLEGGSDYVNLDLSTVGIVQGGEGDDSFYLNNSSAEKIDGEGGNDQLDSSNSTIAIILGGDGEDTITLNGSTANLIDSGSGNDEVNVNFSSIASTIIGGDGQDNIIVSSLSYLAPSAVDLLSGGNDNDVIDITYSSVATIDAGDGKDTIIMYKNASAELVNGGKGADTFRITSGKVSTIDCGEGDDEISVSESTVTSIDGGIGMDTIYIGNSFSNGSTIETIDGGNDNDQIYVHNSILKDLLGGDGDDKINIYGTSVELVEGGIGNDFIVIDYSEFAKIIAGTGSDNISISTRGRSKGTIDLTEATQESDKVDLTFDLDGGEVKPITVDGFSIADDKIRIFISDFKWKTNWTYNGKDSILTATQISSSNTTDPLVIVKNANLSPPSELSIGSAIAVLEAEDTASADVKARFPIYLSSRPAEEVTFNYTTIFGSASATDITDTSGSVIIKPDDFRDGNTPVKFVDVLIKRERAVSDQDLEIFARDIAYKDWEKGNNVDLSYGDRGYYVSKFIDGSGGFQAVGLTSDERFFLLVTGVKGAKSNPDTETRTDLEYEVQDLFDTKAISKESLTILLQEIESKVGNAGANSNFGIGRIIDKSKPPVLAFRGTESETIKQAIEDLVIADIVSPYIGKGQFIIPSNRLSILNWLKSAQSPTDNVQVAPILTGHSLGGALAQATFRDLSVTVPISQLVTFESPGIDVSIPGGDTRVVHYVMSGDIVPLAGTGYVNGDVRILDASDATIDFRLHSLPINEIFIDGYLRPAGSLQEVAIESYESTTFGYQMDPDYVNFLLTFRAAITSSVKKSTPQAKFIATGGGVMIEIPVSKDEWEAEVQTRLQSLEKVMHMFDNRGNLESARRNYLDTLLSNLPELLLIKTSFGVVFGNKNAQDAQKKAVYLPSGLGSSDGISYDTALLTSLFPDKQVQVIDISELLGEDIRSVAPSKISLTPDELGRYLSVLNHLTSLPVDLKGIFLELPVAAFVASATWKEQFWNSLVTYTAVELQAITAWSDQKWEASAGWSDIAVGLSLPVNITPPSVPGLTLTSDTGTSSTDRLTANGSITVTGVEATATWQFSTDSGLTWSAPLGAATTSFTVAEGSYATGQVQVRQSDVVGNTSNANTSFQAFTVETTPPSVPALTLTLAADTGLDPTDGITANGTVMVERLEPRATWQYSIDGGSTWSNGSGSSLRLRGTGARSLIARQLDSQNNLSPASSPLSFFLDDGAGLRLAKDFAQLIYAAYYGRPADPDGLSFWNGVLGSNGVSYAPRLGDGLIGAEFDVYNRIVNDFGNSTEATNLLVGLTSQQKVDQVYQFCFNRKAELDPITGKNYWVDQLDRGNISLAQLAVEVALGAQAEDIVVFSNKISSANSFTDAIDTPPELAAFRGEQARLFGIGYLNGFGATAAGSELGKLALQEFLVGSSSFVGLAGVAELAPGY